MNDGQNLLQYVTALADDALILGQRLSEWCSRGPFLEEDLALANVALDFIGRARMLYSHAAELEGAGRDEDQIAYLRDCREYRNLLIYELPRGDFAFTIARQFMVDAFNLLFLEELQGSRDATLAAIAAKALKESRYHYRRSRDWVLRLGDGTGESHRRIETALSELWGYGAELFQMTPGERALVAAGIAVDRSALRAPWEAMIRPVLEEATLGVPNVGWEVGGGREGIHTEHLGHLLTELQFLQRTYPGLQW
jgi:ring-1,2-phenylacetyl-CoA epoxidase subunit PaaC